jgi:flagellar motor switch/type III secretory pathway protein FliN
VIVALRFGPPRAGAGGRLVREPRFVPRSALPLSAACLVANGVREQLVRLLAVDIDTELIEPVVPNESSRRTLFADAMVYRVKGRFGDAFVSVRPADARRLVAAAFAEPERSDAAALSEIERATLERVLTALPPLCVPLCGQIRSVERETAEGAAFESVAYFEVRVCGPVRAAIGFAMTFEPAEAVGTTLTLDDLSDVELECSVEVARGAIAAAAFVRLECGSILPLETSLAADGTLRVGGTALALGTCGSRSERAAFVVARGRAESRPPDECLFGGDRGTGSLHVAPGRLAQTWRGLRRRTRSASGSADRRARERKTDRAGRDRCG